MQTGSKSSAKNIPVVLIASGFGTGFSPFASGTAGSLVGVAIFLLINELSMFSYFGITLAITVIGIPVSSIAETIFGEKDSGKIVIDEIAGQLITYLPLVGTSFAADDKVFTILVLSGFLLFRFFDIVKPPPARNFENIKGGVGVMMDDVVAGIYALVSLYGVELFLHEYINL